MLIQLEIVNSKVVKSNYVYLLWFSALVLFIGLNVLVLKFCKNMLSLLTADFYHIDIKIHAMKGLCISFCIIL